MTGHTLSVKLARDALELAIDCHEPPGTWPCLVVCPQGCKTFTVDHEHGLEPDTCCSAILLMSEPFDVVADYLGNDLIPLCDGMPVKVVWSDDGEYTGWRLP